MYKLLLTACLLTFSLGSNASSFDSEFSAQNCEKLVSQLSSSGNSGLVASESQNPYPLNESISIVEWRSVRIPIPADTSGFETEVLGDRAVIRFRKKGVFYILGEAPINNEVRDETELWSTVGLEAVPLSEYQRLLMGLKIAPEDVNCHESNQSKILNQLIGLMIKGIVISRHGKVEVKDDGTIVRYSSGRSNNWEYYIPQGSGYLLHVSVVANKNSPFSGIGDYIDSHIPMSTAPPHQLLTFIQKYDEE